MALKHVHEATSLFGQDPSLGHALGIDRTNLRIDKNVRCNYTKPEATLRTLTAASKRIDA